MNRVRVPPRWRWLVPFTAWLPQIGRTEVKADALAAITGAVVVLPQGVAFATIAGMPPEYGLYAGMIPAMVAALFGSSRHLVSGPTTAASVVLFSSLSILAVPGTPDYVTLALTLTFMVGVLELLLGLARMGALVNFISHSVVVGFTAGAALLIAAKRSSISSASRWKAAGTSTKSCSALRVPSPRSTRRPPPWPRRPCVSGWSSSAGYRVFPI